MPRVFTDEDGAIIIEVNDRQWRAFTKACGLSINGAPRTKNPSGRNQPLASGKPAGSRAKGKPPKARKQARKGAGKK